MQLHAVRREKVRLVRHYSPMYTNSCHSDGRGLSPKQGPLGSGTSRDSRVEGIEHPTPRPQPASFRTTRLVSTIIHPRSNPSSRTQDALNSPTPVIDQVFHYMSASLLRPRPHGLGQVGFRGRRAGGWVGGRTPARRRLRRTDGLPGARVICTRDNPAPTTDIVHVPFWNDPHHARL